jgi:alpha-mannosidase
LEFHLVSHTHWDREWYRTAEEFRQRLVDLIDELIAEPPPDGQAFLLDGQAIIIEDYLAVRPANRDRLRALLRAGRLEAGPWYVLADELIPSGEALVRNLLVGRHVLQTGLDVAPPAVLYCPDSFGHPAALPEIAAGFQLPLIVLWRGYGGKRAKPGDTVRWQAPSGASTTVFHLPPDGYEFGSTLPLNAGESRTRWNHIRDVLARRATIGISLIQNGADHHTRQLRHDEAIGVLIEAAAQSGDRVIVSSLNGFAGAVAKRAAAQTLPTIRGELRDSYGYTWTLQGTFATRAGQKRRNAIAERTLLRAEAWCATALLSGARSRIDHLRAAWKTLLQAHPHDTLCGTSIDAVAEAMDVRLASARRQAAGLVNSGLESLLKHDAADARSSTAAKPDLVVIANGVPYERGGVAVVEVLEKIVDEPVGPGSSGGPRISDLSRADDWAPPDGVQLLRSHVGRHRIESARHYPDNDIVRSRLVACVVPPQPGMSVRVADPHGFVQPIEPVTVEGLTISSGETRVVLDRRGALSIVVGKSSVHNAIRFEDRRDVGDLYTPAIREVVATPRLERQRVVHRGPLLAELSQEWALISPTKRTAQSTLAVSVRVMAGSPLIEFRVRGVNRSKNHRIRFGVATNVTQPTVFADAAFGPIERKKLDILESDRAMETPPNTAPLHRYVSLFAGATGATVHSDGLAEYEVDDDGVVWITLVRGVGELSRNDIPERPGHAGWPQPTPAAQSFGTFAARFALQLHGASNPGTQHLIARESDRFLNPLRGFTLRSAVTDVRFAGGIELAGTCLVASAIKESEDGRSVVLRCVNLSDRDQPGSWTLPVRVASAHLAALNELPQAQLEVHDDNGRASIPFVAAPRAVVTVLVRPRTEG